MSKTKYILLGLGIYLVTAGSSFALFSSKGGGFLVSPVVEDQDAGEVVPSVFTGPKTEECPINGAMYPKDQKAVWEERRPLVVMIENHEDSRPQSGLPRADVVYEVVAEGGITRFMGVYYCKAAEPATKQYDLGPVRSARTYFLDWASEYADYPLYNHVGGAGLCNDPTVDTRAKALCQIEKYGWKDKEHWSDMDQWALSVKMCRREKSRTGEARDTEHTMYCDSAALWGLAEERGLGAKLENGDAWDENFKKWQFKDELKTEERGAVDKVEFDFWSGYSAYRVGWNYDKEKNVYLRTNAGQALTDFVSGEQLSAKVVVVQFSQETGPVDDHKHLLYKTVGKGKALIFQDGNAVEGGWTKSSREQRTIFTDSKGKEIKLNRGQIWIEVLPSDNKVEYETT